MTAVLDPADVVLPDESGLGRCHIAVEVGPPLGWTPMCGAQLGPEDSATVCTAWANGRCITCGKAACQECLTIEARVGS